MASGINTLAEKPLLEDILASISCPLASYPSSASPPRTIQRLSKVNDHILPTLRTNMSGTDYKFIGWVGKTPDCIVKGTLVQEEFTPKQFTDDDVDIKISHCGICG